MPGSENGRRKRCRRGHALGVALALVLALTMLAAATQSHVVVQYGITRSERDFERALLYAEAGLNAYLNRLASGPGTGTNGGTVPAFGSFGTLPTLDEFRTRVQDGTYSATSSPAFIRFPPGSDHSGYAVGHVTAGAFVTIVAYGYSRGAVRRVRGDGHAFSIFDWAAIYGINPSLRSDGTWDDAASNYAWKFSGSGKVVGAVGGEGRIDWENNTGWYDGPVVLAGPHARLAPSGPPVVLQSGPNIPPGHPSTPEHVHPPVSPVFRTYQRGLDLPTADEAANQWAKDSFGVTTSLGVSYFETNNHNDTGFRYLVWDGTSTATIREVGPKLDGSGNVIADYTVVQNYNLGAQSFGAKYSSMKNNSDWQNGEVLYGIRAYPGTYYLEGISMQSSDRLLLRTYSDAEGSALGLSDPGNPNPGQAANKDVRFFIGDSPGNAPITFNYQTRMEYPRYSSRFRVYSASRHTMTIKGLNADPPLPFQVNMLAYNIDAGGAYGSVSCENNTYLFGSLLAWSISVAGGSTVEKETPELGPDDRLTYALDRWTELP